MASDTEDLHILVERNMRIKGFYIGLLLISVLCTDVFAQTENKEDNKKINQAGVFFEDGDYAQALPLYLELHKKYPSDAMYNFCLGVSYLSLAPNVTSEISKERAIPHLEFARKTLNIVDITYYLGRAYHLTYQWNKAMEAYESYIDSLAVNEPYYLSPLLQKKEEFARIERYIEMCENGKLLMQDTSDITFKNMGPLVNSSYPDYAPAISADNEVLIFTSRRPGTDGKAKLADNFLHYENVYITYRIDGEWVEAIPISQNINTKKHNASIGLSADAQTLFVYEKGDIYISQLEGQQWTKPKKLGNKINTSSWETHITMTSAQSTLYFVSDRKGGYGGRDIYRAYLQKDGSWGDVENLGPTINTPYDEEAPFIHPDERHLYFASDGHNSMGGFDIFYSKLRDGQWDKPVNMGHPINTPSDDIYFTVSSNGQNGYLSTIREGGFGEKDVFIATMPDTGEVPLTVIRGLIRGSDNMPLGAEFIVTDKRTGEIVGRYKSNSVSGKYLLVFPPGREYDVVIAAEQYVAHSQTIEVPEQNRFFDLFQEIQLTPATATSVDGTDSTVGQQIVVRNAFFDIDSVMAMVDKDLLDIDQKELAYSFFLGDLEQSSPEERKILAEKVGSLEGVGEQLASYQAIEEVHLTDVGNHTGLEMHILGYDTIYTTSSNTSTMASEERLELAGIEVEKVHFASREEVETAVYTPQAYFAAQGLKAVMEQVLEDTEPKEDEPDETLVLKPEEIVNGEQAEEKKEDAVKEETSETAKADAEEKKEDAIKEETSETAKADTEEKKEDAVKEETSQSVTMEELDTEIANGLAKAEEDAKEAVETKVDDGEAKVAKTDLTSKSFILSNVYFDLNSSQLNNGSKQALDKLYTTLNKASTLEVEISGHTCNIGEAVYNSMLSTSRAKAVVAYLVKKGIPQKRLEARGYGAAKPIAGNETVAGRRLNRRTEMKIIDITGKPIVGVDGATFSSTTGKGVKDIKDKKLRVVGAVVCENVKDREPIGSGVSFSSDIERLYFFTNILAPAKQEGKVTHVWYYKDKKMAEIPLSFKGPRWRTKSAKYIMSSWTGAWRVEVVSEEGVVLKSIAFTVK